jgi:hypothetical protein
MARQEKSPHRAKAIQNRMICAFHSTFRRLTAKAFNPAQWKTTWFKGGSEPGVLTLTYLATTRTGHSYVVAVLASNPSAPIFNPAITVPAVLSAIKGAFTLAAHG